MEYLSPRYAASIQFRCVSGMAFAIKERVTQSSTGCVRTRFAQRREVFRFAALLTLRPVSPMDAPAF